MNRRLTSILLSIVATVVVTACSNDDKELRLSGSVDNFTMEEKYVEFCSAYDDLNLALNDMSERGTTKETFDAVLDKSKALVAAAPGDIEDAVVSNDAILNAMSNAFAERGYDPEKISADEGLRQEVQTLYAQDGLADLASDYADYLVKNCGVSVEGN